MNFVHVHLLLNHVPTVGTAIAIALLVIALVRKSDDLKRVALEVFFVVALMTIPAYLSGVSAGKLIAERPGVSTVMIAAHESAALYSFILMMIAGAFAWFGLWKFRRTGRWGRTSILAVVVLAILTMAVTAQAANLGGEIRHPEIMANEDTAAVEAALALNPSWLSARGTGRWITDRTWIWPSGEALHFVGLWLIFGVILVVNLRMLGFMPEIPFSAVHRLLPWAALGFALNTITGMMFVIGTPDQYADNKSFFWKIVLLLVAGLNLLYATVFEGPWHVGAGQRPPLRVKLAGASAILAWAGVMYFGRMLPFIGNAF
jgi:uncharacterized membrane protein